MTLLRVSALTKSFPLGALGRRLRVVLRGIDLEVSHGETLVLMGENGSGKTTLLRLAAGVLTPDSGSITVLGHSVHRDARARRITGFASGDERSFQLRLSGIDNLHFFGALYGLTRAEVARSVDELSQALDLGAFLRLPVGQCSAGMRARLGLSRALLHRPKLLLLDEPTKSIDEAHQASVHAAIARHAAAGGGVLLVTHSSDEARALSSRIARLANGGLENSPADGAA